MSLKKLPVELLLEIPIHLGSFQDLAALARTCRLFHDLYNPLLYKYDVQTGSPIAMFWAARWDSLRTLQLSHAAGANLRQAWTQHAPLMQAKEDAWGKSKRRGEAVIFKEMGRHNATTYVRLFNATYREENIAESLADTDRDGSSPSSSSDGGKSSNNSDDGDGIFWSKFWKEDLQGTKTASKNNSYTFSNFILQREFDLWVMWDHPYPMFWWHPLDLAVQFDHFGIVQYLLDNGIKVQESHSRGLCPFHACPGTLEIFSRGREVPGLPYATMTCAHHPINLAACRGNLDVQRYLLRKVGLCEMAERLTWEEVDDHHYSYGFVHENYSCSEARVLMEFAIWDAGDPSVSGQISAQTGTDVCLMLTLRRGPHANMRQP